MTRPDAPPPAAAAPPADAPQTAPPAMPALASQTRHRLVVLSILLVAAALTTMLYVQFALSAIAAIISGACVCAIFLLANDQARKATEIARLKKELARMQTGGRGPSQTDSAVAPQAHDSDRTSVAQQPAPTSRNRINVLTPKQAGSAARPVAASEPSRDDQGRAEAAPFRADRPVAADVAASLEGAAAQPVAASRLSADPLRDQWAFRPREPVMATPPSPPHGAYGDPAGSLGAASTIESDLAVVQRKIRALADEVNATEAARTTPHAPLEMTAAAPTALESSIDALKSAASSMRGRPGPQLDAPRPHATESAANFFEFSIPSTAERIAASSPPMPPTANVNFDPLSLQIFDDLPPAPAPLPDDPAPFELGLAAPDFLDSPLASQPMSQRLASIMRAIESARMDVFLAPIVGLQNHQVSHYEIEVRLIAEDGAHINDPETDLSLAGGDLLALFDAARLRHAGELAQRLDARGKAGALLADVAGPSLSSVEFLETFARTYEARERIAGQLVLTFSQADVECFTPAAWRALGDMQSFGFRFALGRVQHLDSDFEDLAQRGFAFVKLDAEGLVTGMPSRRRFVGATELCGRLAAAGVTLIADAVTSEATRARLFGVGVLFGQGALFGAARRVNGASPPTSSQAA